MRRLALAATVVASLAGATQFQNPFDRSAGLIGLLPLPDVFGESDCTPFQPKPIPLFASASAAAPSGEIRVTKPLRFPPEGGCEGLEVRVFQGDATASELPTLEYAYEAVAGIVLGRSAGRAQVALATGAAWLDEVDSARFIPAEELIVDRMTYLRRASLPLLRRAPDLAAERLAIAGVTAEEVLVETLETRRVAGALWVRVALAEENDCTGERTGVRADTAWVSFHGSDRRPTVWFFSRGC